MSRLSRGYQVVVSSPRDTDAFNWSGENKREAIRVCRRETKKLGNRKGDGVQGAVSTDDHALVYQCHIAVRDERYLLVVDEL